MATSVCFLPLLGAIPYYPIIILSWKCSIVNSRQMTADTGRILNSWYINIWRNISRMKYQHHISLIHVINIRFSFCYQHVHLDCTAEIARILVQAGGSVSHVHINVRTARLMNVTQCLVVNKKMVIYPWSKRGCRDFWREGAAN